MSQGVDTRLCLPKTAWPPTSDTCIDCGACVPECPYEAIFPEDEVPQAYELAADQERKPFKGEQYKKEGEIVDLTEDIQQVGS